MTPTRRTVLSAAVLLCALSRPAAAGWWEVHSADLRLDLVEARREALATLRSGADDAEAVALAGWWYDNLDNLPEPREILDLAPYVSGPEVRFVLDRIASELQAHPPVGSLSDYDLSGPWGAFGRLDIARGTLPDDGDLPSVERPWAGPGSRYNHRLRSENGWAAVPPSLQFPGVATARWTLNLPEAVDGWLVLEADGSLRLSVDGAVVDRFTLAGVEEPEIIWYRVRWAAGEHSIRVDLAPMGEAAARLSLLAADGRPAAVEIAAPPEGAWAPSSTFRQDPTAHPALEGAEPSVADLLLAADVAGRRGETRTQRRHLEAALADAPEDSTVNLAAAAFFLLRDTGAAPEIDYRRVGDHLRRCADLPIAPLVEHLLAQREGRDEDLERLKEELSTTDTKDARVLQLKLVRALQKGWAREAEATLEELEERLGETEALLGWRLDVLERLEQWKTRRATMQRMADALPPRRDNITLLASACCIDLAIDLVHQLRSRVSDPDLDADLIRLLIRADRSEEAESELASAFRRWGGLPALRILAMMLADSDSDLQGRELHEILAQHPFDLDLRTLAWRRGDIEPFWAPYQVDGLEFARAASVSTDEVDSVLLLDQAVERVFEDGSSLYYYHGLAKGLTPTGARQAATLETLPGAHRLSLRIIKPDGSVIVPAELAREGSRILLTEVEPGDLVEEEYVSAVTPAAPTLRGHLSPYIYRFADSTRVFGLSEYVVLAPPDLDIRVDGVFSGLQYEESSAGGLRVRRWRAEDVPAVPDEPFAPPTRDALPWITYSFNMSWEDVGDLLRARMMATLRSSPEVDAFAAHHLSDGDPVAGLRSLVGALVEEVEAGRTVLDLGTTAGEAFSRGVGNRLGIVAAALRQVGWSFDVVLSRPTPLAGTHLEVPSMDVFGIPVLRVRPGDRDVWIDLKEGSAGVDYLSPNIQGSDGLALPLGDLSEPVHLVTELPAFENPQLEERSALEATIGVNGRAEVRFSTWLVGAQAERFSESMETAQAETKELVFTRMAAVAFPGAEGINGSIDDHGSSLEVAVAFRLPGACDASSETMACPALAAVSPITPVLASLPSRRFPLILQQPVVRRMERTLTPPPGWSLSARSRRLETRWGSVHEMLEDRGNTFHSSLVLEIHATRVEPQDYPEFARFCRAVDELTGRPPSFVKTSAGGPGD